MQIDIVAREEFQAVLQRLSILEADNAILKRVLKKNGDKINTTEAKRISGLSDPRTLKKLFTASQDGENGRLYWSRVEIETWNAKKELTKASPLNIAA